MSSAGNPWLAARNILAVRLDNIGDVVMLGPALRAVKETSPDARITLLASPGGASAAPLLPWVDDVLVWRPVWQDVGNRMPFDPARERELIAMLAERRFDAALIFSSFSQDPHAPGYVCYLAGIPLRAGDSKEFGGGVLTTELRGTPDELHQAERNLALVEAVGFTVRDRDLAVRIPDAARARVPALLADAGIDAARPNALLHPGASCAARRYPAERYAEVARLLTDRGWQVLVTGVEKEAPLVETVLARAPRAVKLLGGTTLPEYAALVERAAVVICNDTLPMHLADATRTPAVVLYSGTEWESQWQPRVTRAALLIRHTPCQPCYRFECPIGLPCLDIPPAEVADAVDALAGPRGQPQTRRDDRCDVSRPYSRRATAAPSVGRAPGAATSSPSEGRARRPPARATSTANSAVGAGHVPPADADATTLPTAVGARPASPSTAMDTDPTLAATGGAR